MIHNDAVLAASPADRRLVETALQGGSDTDLLGALAAALQGAGLDLATIEVACDAVDPERDQHLLRWRPHDGAIEAKIEALELFQDMPGEGTTVLRLAGMAGRCPPGLLEHATDAVAFAIHLAPEATVGFFDDVMVLVVTDRAGGWHAAEVDLLGLVTPVFALALGARLNADAARTLLQTYLGRGAATALLGGRVNLGEVEQIRAVVVYCDLSDFTTMTEKLDPRSLIETLNVFFEAVTRPASRAGGQVSGHVGDAVVLFFPIADPESEPRVCSAAVGAVLAGMDALDGLDTSPDRRLPAPLRSRIGIDVGNVVHGNIGSAGRFSFTIIGTPVNRAARLQVLAKNLDAAVLMTAALADAAAVSCTGFGTHLLKGFDEPVEVVGFPTTRNLTGVAEIGAAPPGRGRRNPL